MGNKYTSTHLGAELILKLEEKPFSVERLASWADDIRYIHLGETDKIVDDIIQDISAMSFGPEFEMTEKELRDLAISLIIGSYSKDTQN